MLKIANGALVVMVLVSGGMLYVMEHRTRSLERDIRKASASISEYEEDIKLLKAEWSSLTRPERIQMLAAKHLELQPADVEQFATVGELPGRIAAMRRKMQATPPEDAIGDLMKKMQGGEQ